MSGFDLISIIIVLFISAAYNLVQKAGMIRTTDFLVIKSFVSSLHSLFAPVLFKHKHYEKCVCPM